MDLQEVKLRVRSGLMWLRIGRQAGTCKCGNEPSGSIKCGECLEYLRTGQLLKKDSAPWSE